MAGEMAGARARDFGWWKRGAWQAELLVCAPAILWMGFENVVSPRSLS
jgi:hypothetical protein